MIVVATNRLAEAKLKFPNSIEALDGWYRIIKNGDFHTRCSLETSFAKIRKQGNEYWFLVPGTSLLLRAIINSTAQVAMVKDIRPGVL